MKQVDLLTFDIMTFDYTSTTRHTPLGRAKIIHAQVRFTRVLH